MAAAAAVGGSKSGIVSGQRARAEARGRGREGRQALMGERRGQRPHLAPSWRLTGEAAAWKKNNLKNDIPGSVKRFYLAAENYVML